MLKRTLAVFKARNKEFLRDTSALGWSVLLPILLVFGFAYMFSGDGEVYKIAVPGDETTMQSRLQGAGLRELKYVQFIAVDELEPALNKLKHHQLHLVLQLEAPRRYWTNEKSAQSYIAERLILQALTPPERSAGLEKVRVSGEAIRYVDWVLPGVLATNMMFNCLFGVGYVIVRYRKNGVLRRLKVTPLTAFEFISAQILSRWFIIMTITVAVFAGCDLVLNFHMTGSYLLLFVIFALGALCLVSMGLIMAARTTSEEFASGMLNLISWPMMILSGVWFSLEGAPQVVQSLSLIFPLTHVIDAARMVMNDGAGFWAIKSQLAAIGLFTACFLALGAWSFRWE